MDKEQEKFLDEQVENIAGSANSESKNGMRGLLGNLLFNGFSIMQAIGCPPGLLEMLYSYALELYKAGKYQDASPLLFFISQMNPKDKRFLFACAASYHKQKKYFDALNHYLLASALEPRNDPYPYFHAADCYLQYNQIEAARVMLQTAILAAGDAPEYGKLKQEALAMHEVLSQPAEEKVEAQ